MNASTSARLSEIWNDALTRPTKRFAEFLPLLMQLGVHRYLVDYARQNVTTCIAHEEYTTPAQLPHIEGGRPWNVGEILDAGKRIEEGEISYVEFSKRVINGGLTTYLIDINHGRARAEFRGAHGELHVEEWAIDKIQSFNP